MIGQVKSWWLASLLAGCGATPQNHYYMLSPGTTAEVAAASSDPSEPTISVALPALLDRLEIVEGTSQQTVQIRDFDRWAAPLDEMVPRVFAEDVAAYEASNRDPDNRHIAIHIDEFMAGAGGFAHLVGFWSVLQGQGTQASRQTWRFSMQAPTDPERVPAVVASMSRLLDQLAAAVSKRS